MILPCLILSIFLIECHSDLDSNESLNIQKTILALFAHPDDESTMGPTLSKWAEEGHDVYLVIATDGRHGVTDHAGIPAGDSLVSIREDEARCSCKALGIRDPIFLHLHDGLKGTEGMPGIFSQLQILEERIDSIIQEKEPDWVVTFGPDGDSGHPDHRLVGAVTTQMLLSRPWPEGLTLHYFSYSRDQAERYTGWNLNYIDVSNTSLAIRYTDAQEAKHFNSIRCYRSQYTEAEMNQWIRIESQDTTNTSYLRSYRPFWPGGQGRY